MYGLELATTYLATGLDLATYNLDTGHVLNIVYDVIATTKFSNLKMMACIFVKNSDCEHLAVAKFTLPKKSIW